MSVFETYLGDYLRGKSDEEIWAAIQELEPVFDYYDFTLTPALQGQRQVKRTTQVAAAPAENSALLSRQARGSVNGVFENLRQPQFLHHPEMAHALAAAAFADRKDEGIQFAIAQMEVPIIEKSDEGRQSHVRALLAAKRIFEAMPELSAPPLLDLYARSNAIVRANIIRAAGQIPGNEALQNLLLKALDDTTPCEPPEWNSGGPPMRLCDVAYNQVVLRYGVKDVLHTLAQPTPNEDRDYHLARLKEKLKGIKLAAGSNPKLP